MGHDQSKQYRRDCKVMYNIQDTRAWEIMQSILDNYERSAIQNLIEGSFSDLSGVVMQQAQCRTAREVRAKVTEMMKKGKQFMEEDK